MRERYWRTGWSGTEKMRTGTGRFDPFIVLNDADLELAVKAAVADVIRIPDRFVQLQNALLSKRNCFGIYRTFCGSCGSLENGDPRDEENTLGPMARFDLRDDCIIRWRKPWRRVRVCYWAGKDGWGR